jgi:hypothetical protein
MRNEYIIKFGPYTRNLFLPDFSLGLIFSIFCPLKMDLFVVVTTRVQYLTSLWGNSSLCLLILDHGFNDLFN